MTTGWQYRIVKKDNKHGIHAVFIDENGDIVNIDNQPLISANSLLDLSKKESLVKEAWDYPVLNFETGENEIL